MKKLQTVVLALFAVFAFGAMLASTASAETTLAAEWEKGTTKVAASLPTTAAGEISLEDEGAGANILCNGTLVGNVNAAGKGEITEVQNLKGVAITLAGTRLTIAAGDCVNVKTCGAPAEVAPEGLPWTTQLYLTEAGTFRNRIIKKGGGTFGYWVLCTVLVDIEDECTSTEGSLPIENNLDAETPALAIVAPRANCTVGGAAKGKNEVDTLTEIKLTNAELLTAVE
ncbi:MAG: hypothetical protein WBV85_08090 [Solirubrobacteraceae bacterium]